MKTKQRNNILVGILVMAIALWLMLTVFPLSMYSSSSVLDTEQATQAMAGESWPMIGALIVLSWKSFFGEKHNE